MLFDLFVLYSSCFCFSVFSKVVKHCDWQFYVKKLLSRSRAKKLPIIYYNEVANEPLIFSLIFLYDKNEMSISLHLITAFMLSMLSLQRYYAGLMKTFSWNPLNHSILYIGQIMLWDCIYSVIFCVRVICTN